MAVEQASVKAIDDLIDDIIDDEENHSPDTCKPEMVKDAAPEQPAKARPVFHRKNKETVPAPNSLEESQAPTDNEVVDAPKPSREELEARLKSKLGNRRRQIQEKKSKLKNKSYPLTPIAYCDAEGCSRIAPNMKCCPVCTSFHYCSPDCQNKDWAKHKAMCGKNADEISKSKLELYKQARDAADKIFEKIKLGNYTTVIHEPGDVPAAMFATIAQKSNVLHWSEYIKNPIFTTSSLDSVGSFAYKIQSAMNQYAGKKLYFVSVLLDRIRDGVTSECIIRLYVADDYGETMNANANGKVTKTVTRYTRKAK